MMILVVFFFLRRRQPLRSTRTDTLFPSTMLFRADPAGAGEQRVGEEADRDADAGHRAHHVGGPAVLLRDTVPDVVVLPAGDRKSTRLNSSHQCASRMPSSA